MSVRSAVAAGLVLNIVMVGSLHAQSTQQTKIRDSSVLSESVEPKAGAAESKTFTWPQTATAGSCRINNGATMTILTEPTTVDDVRMIGPGQGRERHPARADQVIACATSPRGPQRRFASAQRYVRSPGAKRTRCARDEDFRV